MEWRGGDVIVDVCFCCFFFFKQKTAYEMRISDWSSDVCSSDLAGGLARFLSACVAGVDDPERAEQLALELLARGADPFAADAQGTPSVCLAARLDWPLLDRKSVV